MKKIAIVTRRMVAGGIEKALLSMIESIPQNEYKITLFVMGKGGEFEKDIPEWVELKYIYGNENSTIEKLINALKNFKIIDVFKISIYTILNRLTKSGYKQETYDLKMVPKQTDEYDLAISYHVPASFPVRYVINNLKAKKKVAWIHSDVLRYKKELVPYEKFYNKYDKIFSVSKESKYNFLKMYPNLNDNIEVFYNIISKNKLEKLADNEATFDDGFEGIRIVTISRLVDEKGVMFIPNVIYKLVQSGLKFKWYCIGDGELKNSLKDDLKKYNIENYLILLGMKKNPYAYLRDCDIYVQPSKYEGYCTTVTEAKCFHRPMVITNVNGSNEQINNGEDGLIVEANVNSIYEGITKLINSKDLLTKYSENLRNQKVDTKDEINKLLSIL